MKLDDPQWLEDQYDNRARVPEYAAYFERWARESERVRKVGACELDIDYGASQAERLDVFRARGVPEGEQVPVMVFIHGGYWRALDKRDHSFVAEPFTREGVCVVVPNYGLCPQVTIPQIVLQMVQALRWTWQHVGEFGGDPQRLVVVGHSAGAHLAAMMLACRWAEVDAALPDSLVSRALGFSGLYDLEPLQHTPSIQASLRLTPEQVLQASPARLPAPATGTLYTVAGGRESMEFLRQNELIRQAWGRERVPLCEALPGLNHFGLLDALCEPGHRLNQLAWQLLRQP